MAKFIRKDARGNHLISNEKLNEKKKKHKGKRVDEQFTSINFITNLFIGKCNPPIGSAVPS